MSFEIIEEQLKKLPHKPVGFYPTPLHRLNALSDKYDVNIMLKREDLAGPSTISGSKIRLAEFIMGYALEQGYDTVLTVGAYLSNSCAQVAAAAIQSGIKPILFLWDAAGEGMPETYRGNLVMDKLMDVEVHFYPKDPKRNEPLTSREILPELEKHKLKLEAEGRKVLVVPSGATHPVGLVGHTKTFREVVEQSKKLGYPVDYLYHTTGSGGTLPGFIAAKLITKSDVEIRSIAILPYQPTDWMNHDKILQRTHHIFDTLNLPRQDDETVLSEMHIDERFIGEDYAVPSEEGGAAILELAQAEGVFMGPVYTGKGFAGLLHHLKEGLIPKGSNVVFIHSGDSANIFEQPKITGSIIRQ